MPGRLTLIAVLLLVGASLAPTALAAGEPTAAPPSIQFTRLGAVRSGKLPLTVSWPAAIRGASPIVRYRLQRRVNEGSWRTITLPAPTALSIAQALKPWRTVEYRVRAIDAAGRQSTWAKSDPVWLAAIQETDLTVELSPGWTLLSDRKAMRAARATTSGTEPATFDFVAREAAWLAALRPAGGAADVYVDDTLVTRVDLTASSLLPRRIVFRVAWPVSGAHSVRIEPVGDGVVDFDAFLTLDAPRTETLVGAGDISRCTNDGDTRTAAVVSGVPGIVYTTGDNAYLSGTPQEFANCYDPTWGAFRERTRPTPGNHEYYTPGATGYFDYFGRSAGEPGKGWYAYEAGTWRVYAINSECGAVGGCEPGSAQYEWLRAELATEPHRCVAAYWHRPRFSSGDHGSSTRMAAVFALLQSAGAEVVLTGHDHSYERFAPALADGTASPSGIRQFVVGTGGSALYAFGRVHPLTEVRDNSTHGVLKLVLEPGRYSWQFLPAGTGTFTDSGSAACH